MGLETDNPVFSTTIPKRCEVFSSLFANIRRTFGEHFFEVSSKNAARTSIRISGNLYRPVYSRILKNRNCSFQCWQPKKSKFTTILNFRHDTRTKYAGLNFGCGGRSGSSWRRRRLVSEAAADAAAVTTAGKAGEAGAFVAEASPRRVPRAQRRRRPRRVSYRRTEISGFELSDLNENEVK